MGTTGTFVHVGAAHRAFVVALYQIFEQILLRGHNALAAIDADHTIAVGNLQILILLIQQIEYLLIVDLNVSNSEGTTKLDGKRDPR